MFSSMGIPNYSLGQFKLRYGQRFEGGESGNKRITKKLCFSRFWNKDDKTPTSFGFNFGLNRRSLQLSYNRCILPAVFKALLIALTLACLLTQSREPGTCFCIWMHSDQQTCYRTVSSYSSKCSTLSKWVRSNQSFDFHLHTQFVLFWIKN